MKPSIPSNSCKRNGWEVAVLLLKAALAQGGSSMGFTSAAAAGETNVLLYLVPHKKAGNVLLSDGNKGCLPKHVPGSEEQLTRKNTAETPIIAEVETKMKAFHCMATEVKQISQHCRIQALQALMQPQKG